MCQLTQNTMFEIKNNKYLLAICTVNVRHGNDSWKIGVQCTHKVKACKMNIVRKWKETNMF